MATKIVMPMLGLTMSEGTISGWLKKEQDPVRKGEPLFEVLTDKATVQVEAPADGILLKITVPTDQTVPVGAEVGIIGALGENTAVFKQEEPPVVKKAMANVQWVPDTNGPVRQSQVGQFPTRKLITPRARRLAEEKGIDWRLLTGTGSEGQITEADIKMRFVGTEPEVVRSTANQNDITLNMSNIRRIIAERLSQSQQERVHIHLTIPIDMNELIALRNFLLKDAAVVAAGIKISYNDIIVKILGICLKEYPMLNSSLAGPEIQLHSAINLGIAVALEDNTLVVPVIRAVESRNILQIAAESHRLITSAKDKTLAPDEMKGGTFTLSNLGMYGIEQFTAVINPPETAILALGAIIEEPRVKDGQIVIRPMMRVTLAVDHRVIDGVLAAQFLSRFQALAQNPSLILLKA